jgi:hypothetical protein
MGIIIGIFIGMLLLALWFDNYWLMGHYTKFILTVIISIPLIPFAILYNVLYAMPKDNRCKQLLSDRGWKQSNKVCKSNEWFNPQMWRNEKGEDHWFGTAYEMETGKRTSLKTLIFNFKNNN